MSTLSGPMDGFDSSPDGDYVENVGARDAFTSHAGRRE